MMINSTCAPGTLTTSASMISGSSSWLALCPLMFVSALAAVAAVAPGEEGADPLVLRDPVVILFTVPGLT